MEELIAAAARVREKAYAPYSHFKVGAALLGGTGVIYTGCNVENASYGATVCAERGAVLKAVSEGETVFLALAVVGDMNTPVVPCGICRQFLGEFNRNLPLILTNLQGARIQTTLSGLFPAPFELETLK
ncbi:MAG: cytidine deaminase [Firmicutes bacterium]|nr:cytidine deaminase [Bacillota bacterium]